MLSPFFPLRYMPLKDQDNVVSIYIVNFSLLVITRFLLCCQNSRYAFTGQMDVELATDDPALRLHP